jgi:uncharacterized delta-60 repeat protein
MNSVVFLLLGVVLGAPRVLNAGVDTAWVRRYDGPAHGEDWATCLTVDSAGNVYVTGASMSDTGSNTQYLDFVTIKYCPNGDTAWVRRADFGGKDLPSGLGVDAQGNVYVTGTNNDSRMVTVKYSPTGSRLWYEFFGSQGGASDLVLDSHGNIVVCGSSYRASSDAATGKYRPNGDTAWVRFYDLAGFEDYAQATAVGQTDGIAVSGFGAGATTHYDCITVTYDSVGEELWAARYDGPDHGDDRTYHVAVDGSGDVVAVGYGDNGYTTPYDYLTIKYGSTGETLWTRRYDGAAGGRDEAVAVALDHDGSVLVTGYSFGQSTGDDYATVKYDSAGAQMWVARYDGPGVGYDHAYSIAVDGQGNAYVTGSVWVSQDVGGDCATIKYSPSGESLWRALYNGPSNWSDRGSAVAVDGDANVLVAGASSNGFGLDGDIVTIKYLQDGGVAESSEPVVQQLAIGAVPNPFATRTEIRLGLPRGGPVLVRVLDVSGRVVRTLQEGQSSSDWHSLVWDGTSDNGAQVPAGVYMVVLNAAGASSMVKVTLLK